jgi:hypothetical protein
MKKFWDYLKAELIYTRDKFVGIIAQEVFYVVNSIESGEENTIYKRSNQQRN